MALTGIPLVGGNLTNEKLIHACTFPANGLQAGTICLKICVFLIDGACFYDDEGRDPLSSQASLLALPGTVRDSLLQTFHDRLSELSTLLAVSTRSKISLKFPPMVWYKELPGRSMENCWAPKYLSII